MAMFCFPRQLQGTRASKALGPRATVPPANTQAPQLKGIVVYIIS